MSSPLFIYSWNIHHREQSEKQNIMRTNDGLESYNYTLAKIFNHSQPSLICFIETLEKETRDQESKIDYIRKALIVKRKREDHQALKEFSEPSIHYLNFVDHCKSLEKLE